MTCKRRRQSGPRRRRLLQITRRHLANYPSKLAVVVVLEAWESTGGMQACEQAFSQKNETVLLEYSRPSITTTVGMIG